MEPLLKLTMKAFRAPEEPGLCREFVRQHRKVLEDFGITNVTTNNERWLDDPNAIIIVAMNEEFGMMGGIRLQLATERHLLPMEEALLKFDPQVHDALEALRPHGNGEVCSLWNANEFRHLGIPILLSQAVTAISVQVGAGRMVCLVAHYTKKHPSRNGFVVMEDLGDQGTFAYPVPGITAIAMVNPNTSLLEHASPEHRQVLYSLRLRPEQVRIESPLQIPMEVHYQMRLESGLFDLQAYRDIEADRLRFSA